MVELFVLGVGSGADTPAQLALIASTPQDQYVFTAQTLDDIQGFVTSLAVATCAGKNIYLYWL